MCVFFQPGIVNVPGRIGIFARGEDTIDMPLDLFVNEVRQKVA